MPRLFALCLLLILLCACAASMPSDTQTPRTGIESSPRSPEATSTFTPVLTSTPTDTPTVTLTPAPTATPTPRWQLPLTVDTSGDQVFDFSKVDQFPQMDGLDPASINGFLAFLEQPGTGLIRPFPPDVTQMRLRYRHDERFDILYFSQSVSTSVDRRPVRNIAAAIPKLIYKDPNNNTVDASGTILIIFTQFYTPDSQKGYVLVPMVYSKSAHPDSFWRTFINPEWYSGIYYNCKDNNNTTLTEEWTAQSILIAAKVYDSQAVNTIAQKGIATGVLPSESEGVLFPAGRTLIILHGG